jgi:5-methylcytosine-specific restriction endonuclease McrA
MCDAEGRLTLTEMVDHIVPISVRPDLRLVRSNLQGLCGRCHAVKGAEDRRKHGS